MLDDEHLEIHIERLELGYRQIGGLIEAAVLDQQAGEALRAELSLAIAALRTVPHTIETKVSSALKAHAEHAGRRVARALKEDLLATYESADRAREAFERAARFSIWKVAMTAALVGVAAILATSIVARSFFPTIEDLNQRQAQFDSLKASSDELLRRGAAAQFRLCQRGDGMTVPCVRVKEAPIYGDGYHELP